MDCHVALLLAMTRTKGSPLFIALAPWGEGYSNPKQSDDYKDKTHKKSHSREVAFEQHGFPARCDFSDLPQ
ncbi:MAG: hypothetical protein LBP52_06525, partial [Burkholderiaceae bacterium]|nr:hypothetical protein [Burkholderiaceae bacterium]